MLLFLGILTESYPEIIKCCIVFFSSLNRANILYELSTCIAGAIDADSFNLYVVDGQDLLKYEMKTPTRDLNDDGLEEPER